MPAEDAIALGAGALGAAVAAPPYDAVLFDMDGVVLDTAALHAAAWRDLFDTVLEDPRLASGAPHRPFDADEDYRRLIDGRAREDGIEALLASRGIVLPRGDESDPPEALSIHGLAALKQRLFASALAEYGVRVFPGSAALIRRLRAGGVPIGLVTASRNARALLDSASLADAFDVVIDGTVAGADHIPGKPEPDLYLEAARRLGVLPSRAAVVEDAAAGVEAARRGGFGLVVGIDRGSNRALLEDHGADVVLGDVGELDLGALPREPGRMSWAGFDAVHEGHREAVTTLGNGYIATRGAAPERRADGVHYPGTYAAGVYNRLASTVEGRHVEDEHIVNLPNWLLLDVRIGDGRWLSEDGLTVRDERRELDLRRGLLTRAAVLEDPEGRRVSLTQRRLVSMERPHVAALQTVLASVGWEGPVEVRSGVDCSVTNGNVAEYEKLTNRHLVTPAMEELPDGTMLVEAETSQSRIVIALAIRHEATSGEPRGAPDTARSAPTFTRRFSARISEERPLAVEKTVAIVTSRDAAIASPREGAIAELERAPATFAGLLAEHERAWAGMWKRFRIDIDADRQTRLALDLHLFHLVQTLSQHTSMLDAGVPARGLHGEGYRGHVFWDELFVVPLLSLRLPAVSRGVLEYRWRRLPAARSAAAAAGLRGALFPWQSGSDGTEQTPRWLYNRRSERWMADNSRRQLHVGLAVAFDAWRVYLATGDRRWLAERGAEIIIEVARLFASKATHDPSDDRFHIEGVMGPDEYHDGSVSEPGSGLRDNAYTNVLASWVCETACEVLALLHGPYCDDLRTRLGITADQTSAWAALAGRLAVPFLADGVIAQFDGYLDLEEFDWGRYRARYGNIERLDLILESEGDSPNRYRLSKQADVLMLVHLFGPEGLRERLEKLGYPVTTAMIERTMDHYLARTAHGSTLSRMVHASVLARFDTARAWSMFREALDADLDDTQGGTTQEGIHLGAMAGTIDLFLRAFAGLEIHPDAISFTPRLPPQLGRVAFEILYRDQRVDVALDHERLRLRAHPCNGRPVRVRCAGSLRSLGGGQVLVFRAGSHAEGRAGRDPSLG